MAALLGAVIYWLFTYSVLCKNIWLIDERFWIGPHSGYHNKTIFSYNIFNLLRERITSIITTRGSNRQLMAEYSVFRVLSGSVSVCMSTIWISKLPTSQISDNSPWKATQQKKDNNAACFWPKEKFIATKKKKKKKRYHKGQLISLGHPW